MDLRKWLSEKKYAAWWIIPRKGHELKILPESTPNEIILVELLKKGERSR